MFEYLFSSVDGQPTTYTAHNGMAIAHFGPSCQVSYTSPFKLVSVICPCKFQENTSAGSKDITCTSL